MPESNKYIEDYQGVLYSKEKPDQLLLAPNRLKAIHLKPMEKMGKNTLTNLIYVDELYLAEGMEVIEAYVVENCSSLCRAYLPKSIKQVRR